MKRKLTLLALGVLLATGRIVAAAMIQQQSNQVVYRTSSARWINPNPEVRLTNAERWAISQDHWNGQPPPAGWAKSEGADIEVAFTGLILQSTGEKQYRVTVIAKTAEINTANLYMSGVLVFAASRGNGSIVDRNGMAIATMTTFTDENALIDAKVEWISDAGKVNHDSVTQF